MKILGLVLILSLSLIPLACSEQKASQPGTSSLPKNDVEATTSALPQPTLPDPVYERVFAELVLTARNWPNVPEGDKIKAVTEVIDLYKKRENVAILKEPSFYAGRIDDAAATGSFPITAPLPTLVQLFAVMEYDYYNGQNKDELAKSILGEPLYTVIKRSREQAGLQ